jgi:AbrB family looped-hinge helix DNA binding protein
MVKLADAVITSQGQVSIPKKVRDRLQLQKGSRIAFLDDGKGHVYIQETEKPVEFTADEWKQFLDKTQKEPVTCVKNRHEAVKHLTTLMNS